MATTEVSEVRHYAHELDDETTTSDPEMAEMTTMMEEDYELEEANPARENLDGPILESSWEEKEVVITNSINTKCMVRNIYVTKAELPQEGILFRTQFPSLGIFINKKVGFRKN